MTHREFVTWQVWLLLQLNHPGLTEHYLMLIAAEIRRVLHKRPRSVKQEHMLLKFDLGPLNTKPKVSLEQATIDSKARWGLRMGKLKNQQRNPKQKIVKNGVVVGEND